ncbi:hypothetical protein BDQ17DRAFT_145048 [Cyathus striatus]|nr:hypothetical protein BDQ17DRAFT_145048 [Cyathus striatus]
MGLLLALKLEGVKTMASVEDKMDGLLVLFKGGSPAAPPLAKRARTTSTGAEAKKAEAAARAKGVKTWRVWRIRWMGCWFRLRVRSCTAGVVRIQVVDAIADLITISYTHTSVLLNRTTHRVVLRSHSPTAPLRYLLPFHEDTGLDVDDVTMDPEERECDGGLQVSF